MLVDAWRDLNATYPRGELTAARIAAFVEKRHVDALNRNSMTGSGYKGWRGLPAPESKPPGEKVVISHYPEDRAELLARLGIRVELPNTLDLSRFSVNEDDGKLPGKLVARGGFEFVPDGPEGRG